MSHSAQKSASWARIRSRLLLHSNLDVHSVTASRACVGSVDIDDDACRRCMGYYTLDMPSVTASTAAASLHSTTLMLYRPAAVSALLETVRELVMTRPAPSGSTTSDYPIRTHNNIVQCCCYCDWGSLMWCCSKARHDHSHMAQCCSGQFCNCASAHVLSLTK